MAPASSLTALLDSPAPSHDDTILGDGRTLPDVTLGSLGSSFRSEDEEERRNRLHKSLARAPKLPTINSPATSNSASINTPSPNQPLGSALVSLTPPMTVRRSSSHSALPDETPGTHAPRRSRYLRSSSTASTMSGEDEGPLEARYGGGDSDEESENVLTTLSINISPGGKPGKPARSNTVSNGTTRAPYHSGPSKRSGRHSVAAETGAGPMTLRDQEQASQQFFLSGAQIEQMKKDLFNLQLENHFLKDRLANTTDEHFRAMHNENVKLKLEVVNYAKEMKRLKKIIMQQDKGMKELQRQLDELSLQGRGDDGAARQLEGLWKEEKERRKKLEETVKVYEEGNADASTLRHQLDEVEESERGWRQRCEELEEEMKATAEDQAEEMERLRDQADRAQEELEKAQAEGGNSSGLDKEAEEGLRAQIAELEDELERLRLQGAGNEELEDELNQLQDKLAAAQLDLDSRDREIDELNRELDGKLHDHEKEIQLVNEEWMAETAEIKAQVEELRDVLESREQDLKDLREALVEREEDLAAATDRVGELQANQSETHDRLEETLSNIERDNTEKDADLVAANREIEALGQRVYELEEALDEAQAREQDLTNDLQSADQAFEGAKIHYEKLVTALKEARGVMQAERDEAVARAEKEAGGRRDDKEGWKRENREREERHKRALDDRDLVYSRLQSELDAAKSRVSECDRDLQSAQNVLRGLEDERQKLGDEHTSDRFSLELEIERVKRDLQRAEVDLDQARKDLTKRDLDVAQMMDKQRELETRLSSERQGRLNLSDRLDEITKAAKRHEREAETLRDRLGEVEPLLTETQQERFQIQKQSEQQRQERSDLLLRVFKDVNRFLGTEDHSTPANFGVFKNALITRLGSMNQVRADFERKVKETESSVEQRMNVLKRQLEQKWRALDNFESSVKKLEATRAQWRSKYAIKDGELEAAKARNADLSRQLATLNSASGSGLSANAGADPAQIRTLTERALTAEKRAQQALNQLAALESRLSDVQNKAGMAESKWEARVREYENRLKIAGEKIKTEKQGGKERAAQLESQVRDLERQVDSAKRRNQKAEGIVATASHLLPHK